MECDSLSLKPVDFGNPYEVKYIKDFLSKTGLEYNLKDIEYTIAIYNSKNEVVATGSYEQNILKCISVNQEYRDTGAFARIVTHLNDLILNHHKQVFVFTRPDYSVSFRNLGFSEIAVAPPILALLEFGYETIYDYLKELEKEKETTKTDNVSAIIMNCNPFTNGHKYLVETACKESEFVYIFIVEEDRSIFDFKTRYELVRRGTQHLSNVKLLKSGKYIISSSTFPTYFLKKYTVDIITQKQAELDVTIFGKYIAPRLGIKRRYVGTEYDCPTTAAYNDVMQETLSKYGIEVKEIVRKSIGIINGLPNFISASKVRDAFKRNELGKVADFLPDTTREYLESLGHDGYLKLEKERNSCKRKKL